LKLALVKDSYLLGRNTFGLFFHPFKTLFLIFKEQDFSQLILIIGLPVYLFIGGFVFIKGSRFLIGAPKSPWGPMARFLGVGLLLATFLLGLYLFYWLKEVIKVKSQNAKIKNTSKK
jgi:hypothetical protein